MNTTLEEPPVIAVSTWIPLNQQLPELGQRVLVFVPVGVQASACPFVTIASRHSRWIEITGHIINPSHWQHLPTPPIN